MITSRQKACLDFLRRYIRRHGTGPSYREICEGIGMKSHGQLRGLLTQLRQRGFVDWTHGHARSLRLVEQARAAGLPIAPRRLADLDRLAALHGIDRATCLDWLLEQGVRIFDHGSLPPPRECNRPQSWAGEGSGA